MGYCIPSDLYSYGLPPGGLSLPARLVQDIAGSTATTILTLDGHGLGLNDPIQFRAESGGVLPTGLSSGVVYYAKPVSSSAFSVAASVDGAAKSLTPPVTNVLLVIDPPVQKWIDWAASIIDNFLPAHLVPLSRDAYGDYPAIVIAANADLAVARGLQWSGTGSVNLQDKLKATQQLLDRWAKGVPLRGQGASAQTSGNLAVTRSSSQVDPRRWDPRPGRLP